ncbi:MAG: hypothetical protein ABSE63_04260 [Thermoguttaceae bacterium]
MRYANIATKMKCYSTLDADELADDLWADHTPTGRWQNRSLHHFFLLHSARNG